VIPALRSDPVSAARSLLGRLLVSTVGGVMTAVRISEVEAYGGDDDPASHGHRGMTERNRTMFGAPGRLYVYRSYGVHWCANVVCGGAGTASAVLLRGGVAVEGADVMARRRGRGDHLTDGPGKLCRALAITGELDGSSLSSGPVRIVGQAVGGVVTATPRIGITRAQDRLWRFVWSPQADS
jgi:DNA-3-methyladenine glycosylase